MSSPAFVNAGQPHGAIFDDAPRPYHVRDAAILRAAYGPAAVPSVPDPAADDEYTWTEQAVAGLPEVVQPETDRRLAELELDDDWTDEDWLAMGLILMGQMYEREEMNCGHHGNS